MSLLSSHVAEVLPLRYTPSMERSPLLAIRWFAVISITFFAFMIISGSAEAGKRCPNITVMEKTTMKVGVGGGISCEKAHDLIERFYDWYESQPGHAQSRMLDNFFCGRASGTMGCRSKPRWVYADSHVGAEPWTWASPWAKLKPTKRKPYLGKRAAKHWMKTALRRHFGANWRYRVNSTVKCAKRIRRNRVRCQKISWAIGDLSFWGTGTIWYRKIDGELWWYYSFRIKRLNEYCAFVHHRPIKKCIKKIVVR